jgi:hypothetical protein
VAFEGLERCEGKLSRTVLRGASGREVTRLPGDDVPGMVDSFVFRAGCERVLTNLNSKSIRYSA